MRTQALVVVAVVCYVMVVAAPVSSTASDTEAGEHHHMHGDAAPRVEHTGDMDDLHGDGHAYHDSVPHSHDSHPSVRLHSLWITPVLDVNVMSVLPEAALPSLTAVATALWGEYTSHLSDPDAATTADFVVYQHSDKSSSLDDVAAAVGAAAVDAVELVRVLALEASEQLIVASNVFPEDDALDPAKLRMWFNFHASPGSAQADHTHPSASVTGVFYVTAPEGCAPLTFKDPRAGSVFAGNAYEAAPRVADLLVFPAWLVHGVSASEATTESAPRVSIGFELPGTQALLGDVSFSEDDQDGAHGADDGMAYEYMGEHQELPPELRDEEHPASPFKWHGEPEEDPDDVWGS